MDNNSDLIGKTYESGMDTFTVTAVDSDPGLVVVERSDGQQGNAVASFVRQAVEATPELRR